MFQSLVYIKWNIIGAFENKIVSYKRLFSYNNKIVFDLLDLVVNQFGVHVLFLSRNQWQNYQSIKLTSLLKRGSDNEILLNRWGFEPWTLLGPKKLKPKFISNQTNMYNSNNGFLLW